MFGAAGLAMTALGVAGLLNVIRGGTGAAILAFVAAAISLGLAGYFFWGYGWLNKRPELLRKASEQNIQRNPDQDT